MTRLIAGALREAGIRAIARTTGTAARLILEDGTEEEIRRTGKARITEIKCTIRFAARRGAEAIVIECMALDPRLQEVAESSLVKSTIGIITNVREDHLDIMGPDLGHAASALANTIPRGGGLFTAERQFLPIFEERAHNRGSRIVAVSAAPVSQSAHAGRVLDSFDENIALALAVASEVGVPRDVALRGMGSARPDPGALAMWDLDFEGTRIRVVNAFAANDWTSTKAILERLNSREAARGPFFVIYGHRADRVERGLQFARHLGEESARTRISGIMQIGPRCPGFTRALRRNGFPAKDIFASRHTSSAESVMRIVVSRAGPEDTVIGMGNIGGMGMRLASLWKVMDARSARDRRAIGTRSAGTPTRGTRRG